ncbi:MAG: nucleoside deaminase [Candidatus Bathyarchaeota archaeon]|uniref:nucleoside deaminase n=1 Tax=Candidatus Bathycorpusculum sp. TaxID=2994959 RepID=UPI002823BB4E|nr:nucleoside deaminase [Candidatus Termiticorpusculum sp.]MCL2257411.1 nucleoside deaminase [Candidatus Termiticorpusculum sp.]MCL2292469.1 nucleoside deaminase [Candidatus Termiticorpusculum sp.]
MKNKFMQVALEEAQIGLNNNHGGPFGAVIVKDDQIIGRGHNSVILLNDPSAHAEIMAIRDACKNIQSFNLSGAKLYSTCFPCPMCAGAILWARLDKMYYCLETDSTEHIGFDDLVFYKKFKDKTFWDSFSIHDNTEYQNCLDLFKTWKDKQDKITY